MSLKPTKRTLSCERMANPPFSRLEFLRLDKNENTEGLPVGLVKDMLGTVTPEMMVSYPEPFVLQKKLAGFLNVEENSLFLATGSDAAIKTCFEAFVEPDDRVVRMDPTYAMVGVYCKLFGADEIAVGYDKELNFELDKFLAEIDKEAKLVYIANPNSPTGTVLSNEDIQKIAESASKVGALLIVDEAYFYFYKKTAQGLIGKYDNLVITRTFSKAIGLASVRLGYAIASTKVIEWLSRWRPMYEINSFAQHCGCYMLDNWNYVEEYAGKVVESRKWFSEEIKKLGLSTFDSYGNFILVRYKKEDINKAVEKFKESGILVKGGGGEFPLSETLRFSLGTRPQLEKCIAILKELLKG